MTSAHHEEVGRRVGAAGAGDSNNSRGPPTVAPVCRARQPRLPTWKILGGKNRKTLG